MKNLLALTILATLSAATFAQQVQAPQTLTDDQIKSIQHQALETIKSFGTGANSQGAQEFVVPKGQLSDAQRSEINRQALETAELAKRYFPQ